MVKIVGALLINDKNTEKTEIIQKCLSQLNIVSKIYINPTEMLHAGKNEKIDILLFDYIMPELDKNCFAQRFKKHHPAATLIYIDSLYDPKRITIQLRNALRIKKTRDELLKEQEQTAYIFKYSSNELILTDLNFNIISKNNSLIPESLSHIKNFIELLKINNQEDAIEIIDDFILNEKKEVSFRLAFSVGKSQIHTKTALSKITKDNIHCGYLIVLNDYTKEVEIAKQRECFIEMLTHDLKTPVRAEGRALELLYDGILGDMSIIQKDMIREILNSSRYMIRMTDNVLTSLRLEGDTIKLNKKLNSIKHTIELCIESIKYRLEDSHQTIKISSDISIDKFFYDEETIKLVIINLLTNASEYSPKNSTIYINIKKQGNYISAAFRDEGIGIHPEKYDQIFLQQTYLTQRFKKVGTGLGLFVSQKIMKNHNGFITLNTNLPKGSEFILLLPYETNAIKNKCNIKQF